jgi:hypothetical protein
LLQVSFTLSDDDVVQLEKKAKIFGLSRAAYIRQVVRDSFRSKASKSTQREGGQKEVLFAIEALIPVFVEGLAQASPKVPAEERIEQVTTMLLSRWKNKIIEISKGSA